MLSHFGFFHFTFSKTKHSFYTWRHKTGVVCHSGLDPESSVVMDVLARFGSLRLPSVAPLEFIPMKIGAGMTGIDVINDAIYNNDTGR